MRFATFAREYDGCDSAFGTKEDLCRRMTSGDIMNWFQLLAIDTFTKLMILRITEWRSAPFHSR